MCLESAGQLYDGGQRDIESSVFDLCDLAVVEVAVSGYLSKRKSLFLPEILDSSSESFFEDFFFSCCHGLGWLMGNQDENFS